MIIATMYSYSRDKDDIINCLSVSALKEKRPRDFLERAKEKLKCCTNVSRVVICYGLDGMKYVVRVARLE